MTAENRADAWAPKVPGLDGRARERLDVRNRMGDGMDRRGREWPEQKSFSLSTGEVGMA